MDNKFLIGMGITLLIQAAGIVWWASTLELWPAGKWGSGSLPSDVKQDLKIERLEMQMTRLTDKIYGNGQ
jgi:hypothetical protein